MNSYNENLQASVVASLQAQELEQKKMKAALNASMFTLYYAEGASITAAEKLKSDQETELEKADVKEQAVHNSNIVNNLLSSANQGNQYVKQATTNTAVCASNVQIAATAIVKLASDMGSIYSIVNAADFDTDIYQQATEVYDLVNRTAYNAELVSQHAMEASMLTSEVSAATVADNATATKAEMDTILKIATTDLENAMATISAANNTLETASAAEKVAEGALEDVNVEYFATNAAYNASNKALNLNLSVKRNPNNNNSFTVSFTTLQSPFENNSKEKNYPVKDYYVMLVKDTKKTTFSIGIADTILTTGTNQFKRVEQFIPQVKLPIVGRRPLPATGKLTVNMTDLLDTDGDAITLGTNYVVFVMAVYYDDYQKKINDFEDFLSAASATFSLTNTLQPAKQIKVDTLADTDVKSPALATQKITFSVTENPHYDVNYRCLLLPDEKAITKGLLTVEGLRSIEKDIQQLDTIAEEYDPEITRLEAEINNSQVVLDDLQSQSEELKKKIDAAPKTKGSTVSVKWSDDLKQITLTITSDTASVIAMQQQLKNLIDERKAALESINPLTEGKLGFFFNVRIAEQIAPGNYTSATVLTPTPVTPTPLTAGPKTVNWEAYIDPSTTDNFGNLLTPGKKYLPVILSIYDADDSRNTDQFVSVLSDYNTTNPFQYEVQRTVSTTKK